MVNSFAEKRFADLVKEYMMSVNLILKDDLIICVEKVVKGDKNIRR